jgi:hypothetical protein
MYILNTSVNLITIYTFQKKETPFLSDISKSYFVGGSGGVFTSNFGIHRNSTPSRLLKSYFRGGWGVHFSLLQIYASSTSTGYGS